MSLVWAFFETILYLEISLILLLCFEVTSPEQWNQVMKSKYLMIFTKKASIYLSLAICAIILCFVDSMKEMRKYKTRNHELSNIELREQMNLFRVQRNFYVLGFTIFLVLVIQRFFKIITLLDNIRVQSEVSWKQANKKQKKYRVLNKKELKILRRSLQQLLTQFQSEKLAKDLKSKKDSLNEPFDGLIEKHITLENYLQESVTNIQNQLQKTTNNEIQEIQDE